MRKLFLALLVVVGAGVALAPAANPQKPRDDKNATGTQKAVTPQEFVLKATSGGLFEVKSGQFAQNQSSSSKVKQFARRLVQDHTKANQELAALATRKRLSVPSGMSPQHIEQLQRLGKLTGASFDQQFAETQVKGHEETIALFEAQATDGQDADLKAWAGKTLPTLKEHLKMAQDLASSSTGGRGDKNKGDTNKPPR